MPARPRMPSPVPHLIAALGLLAGPALLAAPGLEDPAERAVPAGV
jgi:hypothetical protein